MDQARTMHSMSSWMVFAAIYFCEFLFLAKSKLVYSIYYSYKHYQEFVVTELMLTQMSLVVRNRTSGF